MIKFFCSIVIYLGLVSTTAIAMNLKTELGAWLCAGMFAIAAAINSKYLED